MMTFEVTANRVDAAGSLVQTKETELVIDTGLSDRLDALNPVELLLAALSACIIKGIERVAGTLGIEYQSVNVSLVAHRPDEVRDHLQHGENRNSPERENQGPLDVWSV